MAAMMLSTTARTCGAGVWEITTPVRMSMAVIISTPSDRWSNCTPTRRCGNSGARHGEAETPERAPPAATGGTARTGPKSERGERGSMAVSVLDADGDGPAQGTVPVHAVTVP